MSARLPSNLRALFDQATAMPPHLRAGWAIAEVRDPELRAQLLRMLEDAEHFGDRFLASPTRALAPVGEEPGAGTAARPAQSDPNRADLGDRIGPYRLLQHLGEGGFGAVYMAEQEEPVRRRVALKILHAGVSTREVVARFEQERQALALMDHPHIAKVFDAGQTDSGLPYFAMELVRGEPITRFCDEQKLTTRERIELFVQVCRAVQHAHEKGLIHRDLKPGNILVSLIDGKPSPKVIDFGIAKALGRPLTDKTLFTQMRQLLGTPAYMSPEQALSSGVDADTRSDVYSLGVLLYELLTGSPPLDPEQLHAAGLAEMLTMIREYEPATPSSRLATLAGEQARTLASYRRSEPAKLTAQVRGEVDWIVMRAIDKQRARRYASAAAMAEDLERHLTGEAVIAAPPGTWYRVWKAVRRHRVAAAAALGLMLAAGITVGGVLWSAARVRMERDRAEELAAALKTASDDQKRSLAELALLVERAQDARGLQDDALQVGYTREFDLGFVSRPRSNEPKKVDTQPDWTLVLRRLGRLKAPAATVVNGALPPPPRSGVHASIQRARTLADAARWAHGESSRQAFEGLAALLRTYGFAMERERPRVVSQTLKLADEHLADQPLAHAELYRLAAQAGGREEDGADVGSLLEQAIAILQAVRDPDSRQKIALARAHASLGRWHSGAEQLDVAIREVNAGIEAVWLLTSDGTASSVFRALLEQLIGYLITAHHYGEAEREIRWLMEEEGFDYLTAEDQRFRREQLMRVLDKQGKLQEASEHATKLLELKFEHDNPWLRLPMQREAAEVLARWLASQNDAEGAAAMAARAAALDQEWRRLPGSPMTFKDHNDLEYSRWP